MSVPSLSDPYMVACSMLGLVLYSSGNRDISFRTHLGFSSLPTTQQDTKPKRLPILGQTQICRLLLPTGCMDLEVEASVPSQDAGSFLLLTHPTEAHDARYESADCSEENESAV